MKHHADLLRAQGFDVDTSCYPWFAYKGERFRPTESHECFTALESDLIRQLNRATGDIRQSNTIITAHE